MFKVIKFFTDIQDHDHAYRVGDEFPRKGLTVSEARLAELASASNKRGIPLIEKIGEPEQLELKLEQEAEPEPIVESAEIVQQEEEKPEEKVTEIIEEPIAEATPQEKPKRGRKAKK